MFRRQTESETDVIENAAQGSLLGEAKEAVSVLSPQQAAAYQASQPQSQPTAATAAMAQPIQSPYAPSARTEPVRPLMPSPVSTTSNSFRPSGMSVEPKRAEQRQPSSSSAYSSPALQTPKDAKRVLTVGPEILMKGEVTACDRLVIEGKVDANVNDVHIMELAESGTFKGTAQVDFAEISGIFEGDLVVKSRLIIYASGKVRGKITYGEIEIERGGELTGEIKTIAGSGNGSRKLKEAA